MGRDQVHKADDAYQRHRRAGKQGGNANQKKLDPLKIYTDRHGLLLAETHDVHLSGESLQRQHREHQNRTHHRYVGPIPAGKTAHLPEYHLLQVLPGQRSD